MKTKSILNTIIISLIFCALWVWLEELIYGAAESRVVDDIMMLFMVPFFYFTSDYFANKKNTEAVWKIETNEDTLKDVVKFKPMGQNDHRKNYETYEGD